MGIILHNVHFMNLHALFFHTLRNFFFLLLATGAQAQGLVTHVTQVIKKDTALTKIDQRLMQENHAEQIITEDPSLVLSRSGGPLASASIKKRALADARLKVEIDGIQINDPISGIVDAQDMPLFAVESLRSSVSGGAQLAFNLPAADQTFFRADFGLGSFSTGQISLLAQKKAAKSSTLLGLKYAASDGDFPFSAASVTGVQLDRILLRLNNDQQRIQGLWRSTFQFLGWKSTWLSLGTFNEGGIAGFAYSPSQNLRQRKYFGGGHLKLSRVLNSMLSEISLHSRYHEHQTWQNNTSDTLDRISSADHKIALVLTKSLTENLIYKGGPILNLSHILRHDFMRFSAQLDSLLAFTMPTLNDAELKLSVQPFVVSDGKFLFNASFFGQINVGPALSVGLEFGGKSRLPTLAELYSPQGLILGNPLLKPENIYEAESFIQWQGKNWQIKNTFFVGYLEQPIFYVNRNAFEILPVNTSGAYRLGSELSIKWQPFKVLQISAQGQLLHSKLLATKAPFPGAPFFNGTLSAQFGQKSSYRALISTRYQTSTSSNLFGTLLSPSYLMVDSKVLIPLDEVFSLNFSFSNLLNVLTARDTHQLPLPGREFFVSLHANYEDFNA